MISVVMITKNSQRTLFDSLASVSFLDEIILIDTGSSDNTINIAKTFPNVRIYYKSFSSFSSLRNEGANLAKNDWILALDSDEILSQDLKKEIKALLFFDKTKIYSIPFLNYYRKKQIKCCGWHKERHNRLYHRKIVQFKQNHLHEKIEGKNIKKLFSPIYHHSYHSIDDFLTKMQRYSSLFAKEFHGKKKSSLRKAFCHSIYAFFKSYIIKKGFLGGKEGLIISTYIANTTFYKYLKLMEINEKPPCF